MMKYRLSKKLLFYIVLCSSCFTLLATAFQLYMDYRRDLSTVHESIQFIERSYLQALATSAWDMDDKQLKLQLQGVLKLQDIEYLEIIEPRTAGEVIIAAQGNPNCRKDIFREFSLQYYNAPEGTLQAAKLRVTASLEGVYQRLWTRALIILASNAGKTFLASFCIFLIIQFLITRHVTKIAKYTQLLNLDKLDQELLLDRRTHKSSQSDELDELVKTYNDMRVRLIEDIEERRKAEKELRKHREHLEELVEERTRKLEEANTELESFTYSVSHDLRAPLRAMQGFSQALLEDYGDRLDAEGKEYAQRIDASAQRMETLIQDLLDYSRLSSSEVKLKPVNLGSIVESVLTQLEAEIKEKDAHISVDRPLPEVLSHRVTLQQVVENLITNAIRFVPSEVKPDIHIWAEERDEVVRLWVEDNGIGISPEHHERIFRIFERLHGIESYPGTGIGLAIVKKGAEKLGGKIGVESAPGKGSRFWIELTKVAKK